MSEPEKIGRIGAANVDWVLQAFGEFAEHGPDAVIEILDPDVEVHNDSELANAGTFRGVPGYRRWTERWFDAWEEFEVEVQLAEPVGERHVVVTCQQTGRGKSSGVPVEMEAAYMFEIIDRQAVRFHLYSDRLKAIAAAREGEARTSDEWPPVTPAEPADG